MARVLSVDQLRELRPAQYRRWVRVAALFAAIAYGANFAAHVTGRSEWRNSDILEPALVLVAGISFLLTHLARERLAAWVLLVAVSAEFALSLLVAGRGQALEAALSLCSLVAGVGLLLGSRTALAWALVLSGLIVVPILLGRPALGSSADPWGPAVAVVSAMITTAFLISAFQSSFAEVIELAQGNEEQVRQLFEDSPDGVLALDGEGRIEFFNAPASRILGESASDLLGKRLEELPLEPEDPKQSAFPPSSEEPGRSSSEGRGSRGSLPSAVYLVQGGILFVEVQVRPRRGRNPGWLVLLRNITERRAAENHARALTEHLHQAQKMEAVGRLAGGIAHDFNNLLTVIAGTAEMLAEAKDQATKVAGLEQMEAVERCAALTRQLLGFARKDVVARRPLDLCRTVARFEKLLGRLLGPSIVLDLDLRGACPIFADPGQVEQVLMNLAVNAKDAMSGIGTLTVTVFREEDIVWLEVRDTGMGMDEATRKRAFEPFFTTKAKGRGTGLGLATVRAIVHEHDGRIEIESSLGEGTTFRIAFSTVEEVPLDEEAHSEKRPEATAGELILVVDDNIPTRDVVCRQLERSGYRVERVASGAEAIGCLRGGTRPVLMLSDVIMPAMTGPELGIRVKKVWPEIPILYMSGYTDDALDVAVIDVRSDLILKPFTRQALVDAVRRKIEQHQREHAGSNGAKTIRSS